MRAALALVLFALAPAALGQTTWHVDLAATPPGDGSAATPYVSIQQAIDAPATLDGDTILVAPGEYFETIDYASRLLHVVASAGPAETILRPAAPEDLSVVVFGTETKKTPGIASLVGFTVRRDPPAGSSVAAHGVTIPFQRAGRVERCIVTGHEQGVRNHYDLHMERCTVTGNFNGITDGSGFAIQFVTSSIVRGNASADFLSSTFTNLFVDWTDVQSIPTCSCTGNIDQDPLFWDAAGGDFHLRAGSPCIDAGQPSMTDPDGSRRDMGALPYDPTWAPGTGTTCFGDALLCPCGNGGSGDGGCDIPQATGGIELAIVSFAPDGSGGGTAQFAGSAYSPTGTPGSTLIRSPALEPVPVPFGDGLRCVAGTGLVRVGAVLASGGTSLHQVSHGAGAGTFHYQVWVRSLPATFCTPAPFNLSNVVSVTW